MKSLIDMICHPCKSVWTSVLGLLLGLLWLSVAQAGPAVDRLLATPASALWLQQSVSKAMVKNPHVAMVPASTVKILTALMSLQYWGAEHRFSTEFWFDDQRKVLFIRGLGDPFLISEEIAYIATQLAQAGIHEIAKISTDGRYFSEHIDIDGRDGSNNPYTAVNGALAANFNSIALNVTAAGTKSDEQQTPLTAIGRKLATQVAAGRHRLPLTTADQGAHYFAEILREKLRAAEVNGDMAIESAAVSPASQLSYRHESRHTLQQVVMAMLKYSNNFIANQLFLMLSLSDGQGEISTTAAQTAYQHYIQQHFQWRGAVIIDGAGLSRQNRLSVNQLADVLQAFRPYRQLLPAQSAEIMAKSGTLQGVMSYAGYLFRSDAWQPFAFIINTAMPYKQRKAIATELSQGDFDVTQFKVELISAQD